MWQSLVTAIPLEHSRWWLQHGMCCVFFNFCIELIFIIFYNIEIAFCIFVFDHSWHLVSTWLIGHNNLLFLFSFIRLWSILTLINTISLLWRSALYFKRHTHRQQRLRELFDKIENIIKGKCDDRWWLQFDWNTRGDGCNMKCAVCFQFLYWNIIYCIRQYWNTILYFHIRAFPALSIDSTNWTHNFFLTPRFNRQLSKTNSKSHFLLFIPFSSRVGI